MAEQPPPPPQLKRLRVESTTALDDQLWPINVALLLLAGFVEGVIIARMDFRDPNLMNNGWTWTATLVGSIALGMLLITKLDDRRVRRSVQLATVLSLLLHAVFAVVTNTELLGIFPPEVAVDEVKEPPLELNVPIREENAPPLDFELPVQVAQPEAVVVDDMPLRPDTPLNPKTSVSPAPAATPAPEPKVQTNLPPIARPPAATPNRSPTVSKAPRAQLPGIRDPQTSASAPQVVQTPPERPRDIDIAQPSIRRDAEAPRVAPRPIDAPAVAERATPLLPSRTPAPSTDIAQSRSPAPAPRKLGDPTQTPSAAVAPSQVAGAASPSATDTASVGGGAERQATGPSASRGGAGPQTGNVAAGGSRGASTRPEVGAGLGGPRSATSRDLARAGGPEGAGSPAPTRATAPAIGQVAGANGAPAAGSGEPGGPLVAQRGAAGLAGGSGAGRAASADLGKLADPGAGRGNGAGGNRPGSLGQGPGSAIASSKANLSQRRGPGGADAPSGALQAQAIPGINTGGTSGGVVADTGGGPIAQRSAPSNLPHADYGGDRGAVVVDLTPRGIGSGIGSGGNRPNGADIGGGSQGPGGDVAGSIRGGGTGGRGRGSAGSAGVDVPVGALAQAPGSPGGTGGAGRGGVGGDGAGAGGTGDGGTLDGQVGGAATRGGAGGITAAGSGGTGDGPGNGALSGNALAGSGGTGRGGDRPTGDGGMLAGSGTGGSGRGARRASLDGNGGAGVGAGIVASGPGGTGNGGTGNGPGTGDTGTGDGAGGIGGLGDGNLPGGGERSSAGLAGGGSGNGSGAGPGGPGIGLTAGGSGGSAVGDIGPRREGDGGLSGRAGGGGTGPPRRSAEVGGVAGDLAQAAGPSGGTGTMGSGTGANDAPGLSPGDLPSGSAAGEPSRRDGGAVFVRSDSAGDGAPGEVGELPAAEIEVGGRAERVDTSPAAPAASIAKATRRATAGLPAIDGQVRSAIDSYRLRRARRYQDAKADGSGAPLQRTEQTIEAGLAFLASAQSSDGHWSLHGWRGRPDSDDVLGTPIHSDTAATGLALLSFLGDAYDHYGEKHQNVVRGGLEWLIDHQSANGDLYVEPKRGATAAAHLYSHAIATIALCEAYGMTGDERLREPAQRAIDFIANSQHKTKGGWRYSANQNDSAVLYSSDTSVSGWMVMALRSGELAKLKIPDQTYPNVRKWLARAAAPGSAGALYTYYDVPVAEQPHYRQVTPQMTSIGLLMQMYLGWDRTRPEMVRGTEYLSNSLPSVSNSPESNKLGAYYWYYATQVMFHMGGERWKQWNSTLHPLLINSQIAKGSLAGSWDPRGGASDQWAAQYAGRIYVTSLNLLSLEVNYRYLPIYQDTGK